MGIFSSLFGFSNDEYMGPTQETDPNAPGYCRESALCTPSREGILTQRSVPEVQYEWQPIQQYESVSRVTGDWVAIQQQRDWEQQQELVYYQSQEDAYVQAMQIYAAQRMEQQLALQLEQEQLEIEQETLRQQQAMLQRQFEEEQGWRSRLEQMLREQQQQAQIVEEEQPVYFEEQQVIYEEPVQYEEQPQYFEQPQPQPEPEYVPLPYIPVHERRARPKYKRPSRNFMPTIPADNWPRREEHNEQEAHRTVIGRSKP
jgi:hypothetical protein